MTSQTQQRSKQRRSFYFDSSACSGCKACQVACKDRNGLEVGRLWRRVYEVSGGSWQREGDAWQTDAYAYHLSIACNHCDSPVCAEACPTGAIRQRADGIVLIDEKRCMGCRYCSWACPYGALQYNATAGVMSKCTFCAEDLDAGLPPACVAACPLRALECSIPVGWEAGDEVEIAPLPRQELTEPALVVKPHQASAKARQDQAGVANREEVHTGSKSREGALAAFTLLTQTAAGMPLAWIAAKALQSGSGNPANILLAGGLLSSAGLAAAFTHLGKPGNAWRALRNLRSSWLSREILLAAAFLAGWGLLAGGYWLEWGENLLRPLMGLQALVGVALVGSMAGVYRLRTAPFWNHAGTPLAFWRATLLLGGLSAALAAANAAAFAVSGSADMETTRTIGGLVAALTALLMAVQLVLGKRMGEESAQPSESAKPHPWLTYASAGFGGLLLFLGPLVGLGAGGLAWIAGAAFIGCLVSEVAGRMAFYRAIDQQAL